MASYLLEIVSGGQVGTRGLEMKSAIPAPFGDVTVTMDIGELLNNGFFPAGHFEVDQKLSNNLYAGLKHSRNLALFYPVLQ